MTGDLTFTTFLVVALTTHYLTYVLTRSDFPLVEWFRVWVYAQATPERTPHHRSELVTRYRLALWRRLMDLVTCPWCSAVYVATGVVLVGLHLSPRGQAAPAALVLASASVTGVLQTLVDRVNRPPEPTVVDSVQAGDP